MYIQCWVPSETRWRRHRAGRTHMYEHANTHISAENNQMLVGLIGWHSDSCGTVTTDPKPHLHPKQASSPSSPCPPVCFLLPPPLPLTPRHSPTSFSSRLIPRSQRQITLRSTDKYGTRGQTQLNWRPHAFTATLLSTPALTGLTRRGQHSGYLCVTPSVCGARHSVSLRMFIW